MRTGINRDAWDSAVRKAYAQKNKNSSGVRTLEEIKSEMEYWENEQKNISDQLFKEQGGFRIFTADKEKVKQLETGMKNAREHYKRVEEEYENHPDHYEDKYWYDSGVEKAVKGIVNSAVATIPVIGEVLGSELKAHKEYHNDHSTQANYFDVDPHEYWNEESQPSYFDVDPETSQSEQAIPGLEKYQKPVDVDTKAMELMEEALWLKDDANKSFGGALVNNSLDALGRLSKGVLAVANGANRTAEEMYQQGVQGETAGEALRIGTLNAATQVLESAIPVEDIVEAINFNGSKVVEDILHTIGVPTGEGMLSYTLDFILDKIKSSKSEFRLGELLQSIANAFGSSMLKDGKK